MKRLIQAQAILAFVLVFAMIAAAQGSGKIDGQVLDRDGNPYANVTVIVKNDAGYSKTLTTDKNGKFAQIGLQTGPYDITVTSEKDQVNYTLTVQVPSGQEIPVLINLKQVAAQSAPSADAVKQQAEQANLFKEMKVHFDAGIGAMTDASGLRPQLTAAPPDQKSAIQDKLNADYQTAITELEQAEKGVPAKDAKNHAVVLANLAQAYDFAKRYDDAVGAYQKAIDLQPSAALYSNISTSQANAALAAKDPAVMQQKLTDANSDCDKAVALDPTSAAKCWKNLGIVLTNTGHMQESVIPLQKATQADPKDAQSWFLLGGSLTAMIVPTQAGDKITYQIPAGTTDAYQKCIDVAPTGPYAPQAKEALDNLTAISGGLSTTVGQAPAPTKKKSK